MSTASKTDLRGDLPPKIAVRQISRKAMRECGLRTAADDRLV
jgi:hypothetical protein